MNISPRSVETAAKVQKTGTPALNEAVKDGTVAVSDAAKSAARPAAIQDKAVDAVRAGKATTATQAAGLCDRCRRVGATKDCSACAELKQPKAGKTGRGEAVFGWAEHEKHLGSLIRGLDVLVKAFPHAEGMPEYKALDDSIEAYAKGWRKLREVLGERI